MNDEQAEAVALAVLALAVTVRDEGPAAVAYAAREVLTLASGDPVAALAIAAALVDVDRPADRWWQDPNYRLAIHDDIPDDDPSRHGDHAGYNRHRSRGEQACTACIQGERDYQTPRRRAKRARTASETAA